MVTYNRENNICARQFKQKEGSEYDGGGDIQDRDWWW